jgi:hypothetical protein
MAKRIKESRRHGYDAAPRLNGPVLAVTASALPMDVPEEPTHIPPTLTLVGGTDFTPGPVDFVVPLQP